MSVYVAMLKEIHASSGANRIGQYVWVVEVHNYTFYPDGVMNKQTLAQQTPTTSPLSQGGILQRKCETCGLHTIAGEECEGCKKKRDCEGYKKKRQSLLRRAASQGESAEIPPIVHEVLNSPGQPLDRDSRSFMESRFGHDFSQVRVHTDKKAEESAKSVNALAYTVGQDIVFGVGQYKPYTSTGKHLIAHELAHTIQQSQQPTSSQLKVDSALAPIESAADSAASAVMSGSELPKLAPSATALSRQTAPTSPIDLRRIDPSSIFANPPISGSYTITRVENVSDDVKLVYLSNGERYRVTRSRSIQHRERGGVEPFTRFSPGIDRERVWLELEWCSGATEGTVRAGANVPEQVIQIAITNILSGGNIDQALREASITPFIEGELSVRGWRINPRVETTVDSGGNVTDIQGRIGVETDTRIGTVGVEARLGSQTVEDNPLGGIQGGINLIFTPGAPPEPRSRCDRRRVTLVERINYDCQQERDIPAQQVTRTREVERQQERTRFLYFNYATSRINSSLSASSLAQLSVDLSEGFRVSGVRGFTSPEGSRGPGQRFQGNEQLSRERAEAAVTQVQQLCAREGIDECFATSAGISGQGELYTLETLTGEEVEGSQQADFAAAEFTTQQQEEPHRTPDLTRRLERARTPQQRADIVYPLLRRVAITLTRTQRVTESFTEEIPASVRRQPVLGDCPQDIIQSAFPEARISR
jgi:Domain of unknown function (DUF4157)